MHKVALDENAFTLSTNLNEVDMSKSLIDKMFIE